jgi:hypothetical protein
MKTDKLYPKTPLRNVDPTQLKRTSLNKGRGKVSIEQLGRAIERGSSFFRFMECLPHTLAAADLRAVVESIVKARSEGKGVLLGMGAHPVKAGLGSIISSAIDDGIVTGIATNGAAIIHDFELAMTGRTSENVDESLVHGTFGMAEETADNLNRAIRAGAGTGEGLGRSVGRLIHEEELPYASASIFASAYRNSIPATVHVALGTDIIHMHPSCDGAATGKASMDDFRLFVRQVCALQGGVFINLGSAVLIPEVFLKACSTAHNLGCSLEGLTTLNMDMIQLYRPRINVVQRPTTGTGRGFSLTGPHEIMLPLLLAAVRERS